MSGGGDGLELGERSSLMFFFSEGLEDEEVGDFGLDMSSLAFLRAGEEDELEMSLREALRGALVP